MPPRCLNPNAHASDDPGWLHFCEPYAGGLSVLLANAPEGISEVVNDANGLLTNFWSVLQEPALFDQFFREVQCVPFSEVEFASAVDHLAGLVIEDDRCAAAASFFIHCRQSLAGRMKGFASISRNRTRKGMNEQCSAWLNAIDGLPAVHERLKRVLIVNRPAIEVIRREDGPRTLVYADPPYLHESRATTTEYGEYEMHARDHAELLLALDELKGKFMLSGYHSVLYDNHAKTRGWNLTEFNVPNQAAGGKTKRRMVECLWTNY